jgi:hypothetical protein
VNCLGSFTDGFDQFCKKLDDTKKLAGWSIDYALEDTAKQCIEDAQSRTPVDTGTLFESWKVREDNKQTGGYVDSTHSVTVWSDPSIIATNPKYPDGEYYSDKIENRFMRTNGKYYRGKHMLKLAFAQCGKNLKANLKKQLGDVFK